MNLAKDMERVQNRSGSTFASRSSGVFMPQD